VPAYVPAFLPLLPAGSCLFCRCWLLLLLLLLLLLVSWVVLV
jgi:hypothetical protein